MTTVVQTDEGSFIPASQRPDGTWRKARRVKDGYVPQEEVPLYESKGKQWANRKPQIPVGFDPEIIRLTEAHKISDEVKAKKKKKKKEAPPPPPAFIIEEPPAPVKPSKAQKTIQNDKQSIKQESQSTKSEIAMAAVAAAVDPVKKLRNLKKKIREIEALETKINSKTIKNPEKDQLEKVARKGEVLAEIAQLESLIQPTDND